MPPKYANVHRENIEPSPATLLKGSLMLLIASLSLSLQNVVVRIIFNSQPLLGRIQIGGFIEPSVGNSLLILSMRVGLVLFGIAWLVSPRLHPHLWRDLKRLSHPSNRALTKRILSSSGLLFLSQIAMYVALGNISAGIATTVFFVYPTATILLSWLILGDRPSPLLSLAALTIYSGCVLVIPNTQGAIQGNPMLGVITATIAGIAFSAYAILTQICSQTHRLHPVSFTFVLFLSIFAFALLSLGIIAWMPTLASTLPTLKVHIASEMWIYLWISAFILSITSIVGFLLTNFGISAVGATYASTIGATGPALTTISAWFLIQEAIQSRYQLIGIFLVTLWVGAISTGKLSQPVASDDAENSR
ncbi:MAG: DMT family transporter [Kaiparowitsia implicata GSE-PSE-MK54-09C]|jgi:drug/metabolite transporter (DMT)-like permease|nr:DMT family transporter [Kaiparowitsia implicata GSE-PSE-MK54-09C]